jgi:hypothetical protein
MRLVGTGQRSARNVRARIGVRKNAHADFRLVLLTEFDGISGERILRGRSCDSVVDAAAVTLAIMLDPEVETETPTPPAQAATIQPASPAPQPEPAKKREQGSLESPRKPTFQLLTTSSVGLDFGVMPQPRPEFSLGFGLAHERWSMLASANYGLPQTLRVPGQAHAGGRLWHGSLVALACGAQAPEPPRVGACIGGAYTRVQGRGVGVANVREASTGWISPTASVFGELRLSQRGAFRFSATLLVPLNRPDVHLDDLGVLQRTGVLTAALQAGVIVQVP